MLRSWLVLCALWNAAIAAPVDGKLDAPLDTVPALVPTGAKWSGALNTTKVAPMETPKAKSTGSSLATQSMAAKSSATTVKAAPSKASGSASTSTGSKILINPSASARPFKVSTAMPNNDEFYRPPPGYESKKPGTILRSRKVPKPISLDNTSKVKVKGAWQILYRSTDSNGGPTSTVVTVLAPANAKKNNLFVYNWFSDASFGDCNPSLGMQLGTRKDNSYTQKQTALMILGLSQGWYVAVADDGGPGGIFANGLYEGQSILDSIRAIKQSTNITGINPDPIVTMYGYSGGAIAGTWAMQIQPTYAPDVKFAGAAFGGLLPNTTALIESQEHHPTRTAYGPPVLVGLARDFKNFTDWFEDNLVPGELAAEWRQVYYQCYDSNWDLYNGKWMGKYFKDGYPSLFSPIPLSIMTNVGVLGQRGTPTIPMYIYETVGDDASPIEHADAVINKWCKQGAHITYERNPKIVTHSEEMVLGLPGAMRWLVDRNQGKPTKQGCTTSGESEESKLASKQNFLPTGLIANALAWIGVEVGPNPWISWLTEFPQRNSIVPRWVLDELSRP